MTNDSAWDMPLVNWRQQGSFEIPEIPPAYEPDSEPLVCLPPINRYWLPFVMGALDQLRNPSSWIVSDDEAMSTTLARASKLREMIGIRAECMSYQLQFTDGCALQFSLDGGATWADVAGWDTNFPVCNPPQTEIRFTDGCELQDSLDGGATWAAVTGWDANFGPCVQSHTPIIGLPPNPGDQTGDQLACSIAAYLTQSVILAAMGKAVEAVNTDLQLLTFGASVLTLIPEFILVAAAYDAFATIYGVISEGTLSDYEAALTNGPLWVDVQCCIFKNIRTDGFVTPGNFGAIVSCIEAITSAPSDVISAIAGLLSSIGATGLAQLSQIAGLETGADCAGCVAWCYQWGETHAAFNTDWAAYAGFATYNGANNRWDSVPIDGGGNHCYIQLTLDPAKHYAHIHVDTTYIGYPEDMIRGYLGGVGGTVVFDINSNDFAADISGVDTLLIAAGGFVDPFEFGTVLVSGPLGDTNPFGTNNCTA